MRNTFLGQEIGFLGTCKVFGTVWYGSEKGLAIGFVPDSGKQNSAELLSMVIGLFLLSMSV